MIDQQIDAVLREAGMLLQQRDVASARERLRQAIATFPDQAPLHAFAGLIACRSGDLVAGVEDLRSALRLNPQDRSSRLNLVMALSELGRVEEAGAVALDGPADDPRLASARGYALLQRGDHAAAIIEYERAVAAVPADGEGWNNLGNARAGAGDLDGAIAAFRQAIALRPADEAPRLNAASALAAAGLDRPLRDFLREASVAVPTSAEIQYQLALAEAGLGNFDSAEMCFRAAITRNPQHRGAYNELGLMLENLNRVDELAELIAYAQRQGLKDDELAFLKAWELRRRGDFAGALATAQRIDPSLTGIRTHQLLAEIHDRLGDADAAFPQFEAMNAGNADATTPAIREDSARYLEEIRQHIQDLAPAAVANWSAQPRFSTPPSPIFIAGFPRSGTTLTDTLLMGIPNAHVMEELPLMRAVEVKQAALGPLGSLREDDLLALRRSYFEELADQTIAQPESLIVDKHPLHMARMGLVHRLFPDAKVIFVQRHPCDVLLSCFFSNFQPNRAMLHFQTLAGAAALYDAAFTAWFRALEALPLNVHVLRYESMIADLEGEMRRMMTFLDLPWTDAVLDNQANAAKRGQIKTASYAQVIEPIYTRSLGRWHAYRRHLEPVLPVMKPWIERLGYTLDPDA